MDYSPYIVLSIYIVMMVAIAVISRKKSKTLNDFLLAGRGLGGVMSAFAYGTTYFSSVIFIGYAGKFGWSMGISAIWIGVANALIGSFLAWKILANRTRRATHSLGAKTMPEFFAERYESKHIKLFSAIIIFIFLIPYSASVYQGLGYLFEMVFQIDFIWCILIMAGLTALYLFFGGYFATALSDFVQGIIMIIGVILMVAFLLANPMVNGAEGLKKLTEMDLGIWASTVSQSGAIWDTPLFNLIILMLLTSFGMWGLPQSVHKFYAIKDKKAINTATWVSSVFCLLIGFGAYFTGAFGKLFFQDSMPGNNPDMIVPEMLSQALPSVLLGIIVVLVLSASMSTLSSLSLSGASAITVDAYKGYIDKKASDKKINIIVKCMCLLFIAISVVLAVTKVEAIVTLMSLSWGTLAGCFIGPYVLGLFSKKITKAGAYASMIGGLLVTLILVFVFGAVAPQGEWGFAAIVKGGIARAPFIGVIAMVFSFIITPLVSLFTQKPSKEILEKSFQSAEEDKEKIEATPQE